MVLEKLIALCFLLSENKSEITDITSLIRFPLIHSFKIDKRIDQEAIRAYIEKAKEFGINIDI